MYTKPKGTQDLLPNETFTWQALENLIRKITSIFNYEEIRTPIFEQTDLYHRSVGESSDIVTKETYDFIDRGGRSNTLRPEGTAGVIRSIIENKLYTETLPLKLYYMGPMFRYERSQKGRQRQFHQFGCELVGSYSPLADAEVISLAYTLVKALRLPEVKIHINSLGDTESINRYKSALKEYLGEHIDELCEDCRARYNTNPLRILDCKIDKDSKVFENIPHPIDYLTDEDKAHFNKVLSYLDAMGIEYEIDNLLVRGLDYYTHTIFEVMVSQELLGSQNTIAGGGRYNHLVKECGGPDMGACGFGFGLERLIIALNAVQPNNTESYAHLFMIALGENARLECLKIVTNARMCGLTTEMSYEDANLKAQFKQSEKVNAKYIMIIGDDELESGVATLKNTETKVEKKIKINDVYQTVIDEINEAAHKHHHCHCEDCDGECEGDCDCHGEN